MAVSIKELAEQCGVSYQRVQRLILQKGFEDSIIKTQKPYQIPEGIAEIIRDYFKSYDSQVKETVERGDTVPVGVQTENDFLAMRELVDDLRATITHERDLSAAKDVLIQEKEKALRDAESTIASQKSVIASKDDVIAAKEESISILRSEVATLKELTGSVNEISKLLGETQRNISLPRATTEESPVISAEIIEIPQETETETELDVRPIEPEPTHEPEPKKPLSFGDLWRLWRDSRKK